MGSFSSSSCSSISASAYSPEEPADSVWGRAVLAYVDKAAGYGLACCDIACDVSSSDEKLTEKYLPSFERDREILEDIMAAAKEKNWDKLYQAASTAHITPLGKAGKLPPEAEIAKAARSVVEEMMDDIRSCVVSDNHTFEKEINFTGRMVRKLMSLMREYYAAISEAKARRKILDFVDLEHMAVNLLVTSRSASQVAMELSSSIDYTRLYRKTETAIALAEQFDEIMLDEYQDTNAIQSLIFSAVAKNPSSADKADLTDGVNMFMVGDMKQSIYRFRKAVPELFMEKFSRYTPFAT